MPLKTNIVKGNPESENGLAGKFIKNDAVPKKGTRRNGSLSRIGLMYLFLFSFSLILELTNDFKYKNEIEYAVSIAIAFMTSRALTIFLKLKTNLNK